MRHHIGKILPIDGYAVICHYELSSVYFQSLTHLYQPLIGAKALALYQTLHSESLLSGDTSFPQTHHTLMNYISLPLDEIYQERLKLEAIGLLKTFKRDTEENTIYTYQLLEPFTPMEFLQDGMLSQLLYHHLGDKQYRLLRSCFEQTHLKQVAEGTDVTKNFNDVFDMTSTLTTINLGQEINSEQEPQATNGPPTSDIDFDWLEQMLKQRMLPTASILTEQNKKLMNQMIHLYNLANHEIEKALLWAINDENSLNQEEFKSACLDLFQTKQTKSSTKVINTKDKLKTNESDQAQPVGKEEQFIQLLEQISPRQLLEDLSGGNQASTQDLKVISDVMSKQGLTPGVMNVLVHYVLLKTDMKLTKSYMEKIASHWARKNVKTVRQAMTMAKAEHKKYQQWGNNKQNYNYYKKPTKKEVIPDWFHDRNNQKAEQQHVNQQDSNQQQETNGESENAADLLKNYLKDKKSNQG
ncbi:replication initiation and membrane attachment family protein [Aquibacillus sediminis]|uniref:replication initiation and membrane attachment family protein n=1 Tax=Aquibacillus sediminis TaxID=2574734 RepID=UPI001109106E|nr:DnaD domain protein [Aquibacillus sediminis]